MTTARCKRCKYNWHPTNGSMHACVYILYTGVRRGCPAGDECTRFTPGKKRKRQIWYKGGAK